MKEKTPTAVCPTITKDTPGIFGAQISINESLKEITKTIQKYLTEEDEVRHNEHQRNITLSINIDKNKVVTTYIVEAVDETTGKVTKSEPNKSLFGAIIDLEVKKGMKILKNDSF